MVLIEASTQVSLAIMDMLRMQAEIAERKLAIKERQAEIEAALMGHDDVDALSVTMDGHAVLAFFKDRQVVLEAKPRPEPQPEQQSAAA